MRVLVTGSAGFIGRHTVLALAAHGHDVLGLDCASASSEIATVSVVCDILNLESLVGWFSEFRPDALIHLAARTDLEGGSLDDYAANIQGVVNVVSAIRQTPSLQRAIFSSSQLVHRPGRVPAHESDYQPTTLYGRSKVRTEQIVREGEGGGVDWCLVRPTTVWGPGMSPHYQRFLRMIARGHYFHIGQEPVWKTYGYVGNVVHEYLALLETKRERVHGRTLYVGDYEPLSLRAWADGFARALGAPPIRSIPRVLARAMTRVGDSLNVIGWKAFPFNSFRLNNVLTESVYDLAETRAICGALPFTIEMGIEETVRWFRKSAAPQARGRAASRNG